MNTDRTQKVALEYKTLGQTSWAFSVKNGVIFSACSTRFRIQQ